MLLSCLGERFFAPSAAGNDTDGCHADTAEPLVLAARHPDADSAVVGLADDEGLDAACADELAAVVGPGFDVADVCTDRDLLERQGVSVLHGASRSPGDRVPDTEALGGKDVDLFAVVKPGEGDRRVAGRVVLDIDDAPGCQGGVLPGMPELGLVPVRRCTIGRTPFTAILRYNSMCHSLLTLHYPQPAEDLFSRLCI